MLRMVLCEIFETAAVWRSIKSCDSRSDEASEIFKRLIATVPFIEEGTLLAYSELWDADVDRETHSELVRAVGFGFWPATASEFVTRFIADRTGRPSR